MEFIILIIIVWGGIKLFKGGEKSVDQDQSSLPPPPAQPPGPNFAAPPAQQPVAEAASAATDVPVFNVVSLGTSGAGKTVFLASMFHELTVSRHGRPYALEASMADITDLGGIYTKILDTSGDWPRSTRVSEARDFRLRCVVRTQQSRHELFEVSYLDYAGELFDANSHRAPDKLEELGAHIRQAHALFGMLDGRRLASYLRGEDDGVRYMHGEILPMIGLLAASSCPIHFIVSKWDIVRNIGEGDSFDDESRLSIVRSALLQHETIAHLVQNSAAAHRTIRLIPVSAVGDGFAHLENNGEITKVAGATISPANLEVPFAAVLPDYFDQIEARLMDSDRQAIQAQIDGGGGFSRKQLKKTWKTLSNIAHAAINTAIPQPGGFALSAGIEMIFMWVSRPATARAERINRADHAGAEELASRNRAQAAVLDSFEKSVWMLEVNAPSSILQRGMVQ